MLPLARSGNASAFRTSMGAITTYTSASIPAASSTLPTMDGTATIGVGTTWARADHIHPTDTTRYAASNPSGYQTAAQVTTALAPYAPLAAPVFTGDARAVTPTYGDNDTSIATTAFVQTAVAPYANNLGRNLVHNALFNVQQRGAGPWTASGSYMADRWIVYTSLDTDSLNVTTLTDTDRAQIGDETARYGLANTFTGNAGAASYSVVQQHIEDQRRLAGRTVTVSFWAWTNTAGLKLGVAFAQTFGSGGSPSAAVNPNGTAVTLAAAWTRCTVSVNVPSVTGKTFGTNGDDYLGLEFWYSCGTTNNAHAGSIGVQSGAVILWGVQLEIGSVATPLDYGGTPQQQLAECQRFYQVVNALSGAGDVATGTFTVIQSYLFPVAMRAGPTLTPTWGTNTNMTPTVSAAGTGGGGFNVTGSVTGPAQWGFNLNVLTASADL